MTRRRQEENRNQRSSSVEAADDYWEDPTNVEAYAALVADASGATPIARLAEWFPPEASVLELGMGMGGDLALLSQCFAQVTGSDRSRSFLRRYRNCHPEADLLHLDAVTLETDRCFDAIYSNKVLPYLTRVDLRESLRAQARVLRPGGIALHTFWYGEGEEVQAGLRSVNYNEAAIRTLLETLPEPFERLRLERYRELEAGDSLLMIIRKPAMGVR